MSISTVYQTDVSTVYQTDASTVYQTDASTVYQTDVHQYSPSPGHYNQTPSVMSL